MLSFVGTLLAALIGAMLAPYFLHFLNLNKNKKDEMLRNLEKAYLLVSRINVYANQTLTHLLFFIAAQQGKITQNQLPKMQEEEPFSGLHNLLDYHLNAPSDFIDRIISLQTNLMMPYRACVEAISKTAESVKLHTQAIEQCLDAMKDAKLFSSELAIWIKAEKMKIETIETLFEKRYWIDKINWLKSKIKIQMDN